MWLMTLFVTGSLAGPPSVDLKGPTHQPWATLKINGAEVPIPPLLTYELDGDKCDLGFFTNLYTVGVRGGAYVAAEDWQCSSTSGCAVYDGAAWTVLPDCLHGASALTTFARALGDDLFVVHCSMEGPCPDRVVRFVPGKSQEALVDHLYGRVVSRDGLRFVLESSCEPVKGADCTYKVTMGEESHRWTWTVGDAKAVRVARSGEQRR